MRCAGCGRCSRRASEPVWAAAASTVLVSLEDQVRASQFAIFDERLSGPVNITGPALVTNAEFTAALGRAVNRPTPLMTPSFAVRAALGEFADETLLSGQRAIPAALERAGFGFHHNTVVRHCGTPPRRATSLDVLPGGRQVGVVPSGGVRSARERARRCPPTGHRGIPRRRTAAQELADARAVDGVDKLLLLEHPSVYTAGRRTLAHERPADGTPVIDTDRGGKITWHGPGQLVGYPIIGLAEPLDVVNYVRRVEESLIKVCTDLGLQVGRVDGRSGVWVPADGGGQRAKSPPSVCGCRGQRRCTGRAQLRLRPRRVRHDRAVRHKRRRWTSMSAELGRRVRSTTSGRRSPTRCATPGRPAGGLIRQHTAARVASTP